MKTLIQNAKIIDGLGNVLESGVSVKDTADQVGYDSLNNFYKYFNATPAPRLPNTTEL